MSFIKERPTKNGIKYDVRFKDQYGVWKSESCPTKALAEGRKIEIDYEIMKGIYKENVGIRFKETAIEWLTEYKTTVKPSSYNRVESICNAHLFPYFRNADASKIDRQYVLKFRRSLLELTPRLSPKTINDIIGVLKRFYDSLTYDGQLQQNPCQYVKKLMYVPKEREILDSDEVHRLLSVAKGQIKTFIAIALYTGMRSSEIRALKLEDIDLPNRRINIKRNLYRKQICTPKNGKGRTAYINDILLVELMGYLHDLDSNEWLFPTLEGRPHHDTQIIEWFNKAVSAAGIRKHITLHCLRHGFCTAGKGLSAFTLRDLAGHSDIKTTQGYTHPGDDRDLIDAVNLIGKKLQGE
jgi:integrase